jgi:hypothetical protein
MVSIVVLVSLQPLDKFCVILELLRRVESLRRRMTVQATTETDGKEYICQLPSIGMIGEIPTQADGRDYLVAMREEFFIAFDRLAEFTAYEVTASIENEDLKEKKS